MSQDTDISGNSPAAVRPPPALAQSRAFAHQATQKFFLVLLASTSVCVAAAPRAAYAQPHSAAPVAAAPGAAAPDADETARQTPPPPPPPGKNSHEQNFKMSKFEARHIRHACRDRANEHGLKGQDRESFLLRCFFGRRAQRAERRECARLAVAQGLDKAAQRDFERECMKERRARAKPVE